MKLTILHTLIFPQSGIAFSAISSLRFLKFIM
ncbi:anti-adapter protein iraM, partial [Klebsiella pneumoniae]